MFSQLYLHVFDSSNHLEHQSAAMNVDDIAAQSLVFQLSWKGMETLLAVFQTCLKFLFCFVLFFLEFPVEMPRWQQMKYSVM